MATQSVGYLELLRQNKAFRRLWYGQIVSQLGDWFNSIALYALLYNLTGSGQAVGALLVAQFLPATLVGPWSGVIVDRLPRKMVLIVTDVMRAVVVLALLLVREPGDAWIIYVVTVLNFS
ncbi:MAG: MFS transporter, partial [Chloroflexota bacterium]